MDFVMLVIEILFYIVTAICFEAYWLKKPKKFINAMTLIVIFILMISAIYDFFVSSGIIIEYIKYMFVCFVLDILKSVFSKRKSKNKKNHTKKSKKTTKKLKKQ